MCVIFSRKLSKSDRQLAQSADLLQLMIGALKELGLESVTVNCRLTTPIEVRQLNREFAGSDHTTDVLAFPAASGGATDFQLPPGEMGFLGDIVISVRTAATQAELIGDDPQAELRLLAVHGLLHLLGHDHGEDAAAARMTKATEMVLGGDAARRGATPPRAPALRPRG
ncbi:MAG: rRNA maturation RNase YbeY [Candidatus Dormiibacterota bacterium]